MEDYYQILGIPRSASAQLVKIAFEGKMKALDDPRYNVSPAARRAEELQLKNAHVTLSVAAKRAVYDEKLTAWLADEPGQRGGLTNSKWVFASILVAVVALGLGAQLFERSKEKARLKAEGERIALEQSRAEEARAEREQQANESREAFEERNRQRNEQTRLARERSDTERWRNATEAQSRSNQRSEQYQQSEAAAVESRLNYEQRIAEERARRQEEQDRYAAQREVERQKQYLRQKEYDEERARTERHQRIQMEEYQRKMQKAQEEALARQPR